jgi:hypothetical protein
MTGRAWAGAAVTAVAVVTLGTYFAVAGLDRADKLASVFGLFVALTGLVPAVWGFVANRRSGAQDPSPPGVSATGGRSVTVGENGGIVSTGDGASNVHMRAEASDQARVYQALGDQNITER